MKKLFITRGGEISYSAPSIERFNISVEQGFAASAPVDYGDEGQPGVDPGAGDDYGDF